MTASIHSNHTFRNIDMSGGRSDTGSDLNIPLQIVEEKFERIELSETRHVPTERFFLETSLHSGTRTGTNGAQTKSESTKPESRTSGTIMSDASSKPVTYQSFPHTFGSPFASQECTTTLKRRRDSNDSSLGTFTTCTESMRKFYGYDDIGNVFAAHRNRRGLHAAVAPYKKYRAMRRNSVLIRPEYERQDANLFPDIQRAVDAVASHQMVKESKSDSQSTMMQMIDDVLSLESSCQDSVPNETCSKKSNT